MTASLKTAEAHISTEFGEPIDVVVATVSRVPRYAMVVPPGRLDVVTTLDGVADFYVRTKSTWRSLAARHRLQIATDWYVFFESVSTRERNADGARYTVNNAVLFPTAADGIVGEFLWEKPAELVGPLQVEGLNSPEGVDPPLREVANVRTHELFLENLVRSDLEGIRRLLSEQCVWATRSYLRDSREAPMIQAESHDSVLEYLSRFLSNWRVVDASCLQRVGTNWYVFAEEVLVLADRSTDERAAIRLASIYPIDARGKIAGQLGYGTAPTDVPDIERAVGRFAFYESTFKDPINSVVVS
jgi:hypothetical protein